MGGGIEPKGGNIPGGGGIPANGGAEVPGGGGKPNPGGGGHGRLKENNTASRSDLLLLLLGQRTTKSFTLEGSREGVGRTWEEASFREEVEMEVRQCQTASVATAHPGRLASLAAVRHSPHPPVSEGRRS
jgi:hypothetical protein